MVPSFLHAAHAILENKRHTKNKNDYIGAFRKGYKQLTERSEFHAADSISITFVAQKNEKYHDTVTQHSTTDKHFCPVKVWSAIYNRVVDLQDANSQTTINSFHNPHHKRTELITSTQVLHNLRWAAEDLGADNLGYKANEIGCHSIRSGAAMAMYLAQHPMRVPTYTIMLQGRWCSDAFLRYIRKQVKEFSKGVSEAMISNESYSFFTIPNCTDDTDLEDPRLPNNERSLTSTYVGDTGLRFTRNHPFA